MPATSLHAYHAMRKKWATERQARDTEEKKEKEPAPQTEILQSMRLLPEGHGLPVSPSPATHAILIQLKAGETADLL